MGRSTVLFRLSPLLFTAEVFAGVFQDGFREGEIEARRVWSENFGSDCSEILPYSKEIQEELVQRTYNYEAGLAWKVEAFRRGGRQGATQELNKNQKECLESNHCELIGKVAAQKLANEFCGVQYTLDDFNKMQVQMCRSEALLFCEDTIYSELENLSESQESPCYREDQESNVVSKKSLMMLQDQCELQVMKLVTGDDTPTVESKSNNENENSDESDIDSDEAEDEDDDDEKENEDYDDKDKKKGKKKKKKKKSKKGKGDNRRKRRLRS